MSKKVIIIILAVYSALLFLFGLWVGRKTAPKISYTPKVEIRTEKVSSPAETNEKIVGSVYVPVKGRMVEKNMVEKKSTTKGNTEKSILSHYANRDSTSEVVEIPITQKEYKDSNYTAYVSGFNAKLDSIEVRTKVVTYTKSVTKFRTWNIGLTGGYGYGFRSKQLEPFIGIGITLNLFR